MSLDKYLESKDRGWFYFKDDYTQREYRWDREQGKIRIVDYYFGLVVNEVGIPLSRILKLIYEYKPHETMR